MTPTERSMPAVRMTSVWAMPRMPMIVTWVSMVERLLAVAKREELTMHAQQQAEQQHDERHHRRIGVQETLRALQEGKTVFVERSDGAVAPR